MFDPKKNKIIVTGSGKKLLKIAEEIAQYILNNERKIIVVYTRTTRASQWFLGDVYERVPHPQIRIYNSEALRLWNGSGVSSFPYNEVTVTNIPPADAFIILDYSGIKEMMKTREPPKATSKRKPVLQSPARLIFSKWGENTVPWTMIYIKRNEIEYTFENTRTSEDEEIARGSERLEFMSKHKEVKKLVDENFYYISYNP